MAERPPKKPPPLAPPPHFAATVPVQRKLKNGIPGLIVENHQLPIVAVDLVIKTGHDGDPIAKAGLSDLVAAMLTEGTRTRSASDFAEAVDNIAASLNAQAVQSATRVHLNCLSDTLPEAIDLPPDAAQHPAFRPPEFQRVRGIHVATIMQKTSI